MIVLPLVVLLEVLCRAVVLIDIVVLVVDRPGNTESVNDDDDDDSNVFLDETIGKLPIRDVPLSR